MTKEPDRPDQALLFAFRNTKRAFRDTLLLLSLTHCLEPGRAVWTHLDLIDFL